MTDATRSVEIPEAAVDAALDVVMDDGHNGLDCRPDRNLVVTVRAALEAALPYLAPAGVSDETVEIYFCPVGGEVEQRPGGGFDVCCDEPERHIPLEPDMIDQAVSCWLGLRPAGDGGLRDGHNHPPRCCCASLDMGASYAPDDDYCPGCNVHGVTPAVPQPVDREALGRIRAYLAVAPSWDELTQAWDQEAGAPRKILASDLRAVLALLAGEQEQVEK